MQKSNEFFYPARPAPPKPMFLLTFSPTIFFGFFSQSASRFLITPLFIPINQNPVPFLLPQMEFLRYKAGLIIHIKVVARSKPLCRPALSKTMLFSDFALLVYIMFIIGSNRKAAKSLKYNMLRIILDCSIKASASYTVPVIGSGRPWNTPPGCQEKASKGDPKAPKNQRICPKLLFFNHLGA